MYAYEYTWMSEYSVLTALKPHKINVKYFEDSEITLCMVCAVFTREKCLADAVCRCRAHFIFLLFTHHTLFISMDAKILFDSLDVPVPDIDTDAVASWLTDVAHAHGMTVGKLAYMFCSDSAILEANRLHLGHDYYTDIITFDYSRHPRVSGDMLISVDTVRSNAEAFGTPYSRELARVIVHGLLHLCGIDDKAPGARAVMESHEDAALAMAGSDITDR